MPAAADLPTSVEITVTGGVLDPAMRAVIIDALGALVDKYQTSHCRATLVRRNGTHGHPEWSLQVAITLSGRTIAVQLPASVMLQDLVGRTVAAIEQRLDDSRRSRRQSSSDP